MQREPEIANQSTVRSLLFESLGYAADEVNKLMQLGVQKVKADIIIIQEERLGRGTGSMDRPRMRAVCFISRLPVFIR